MIVQHANLFGLADAAADAAAAAKSATFRRNLWGWVALASGVASAYHGGKRNGGSIWQTVKWGALGTLFPIFTPTVAAVQGFAKPARGALSGTRRPSKAAREAARSLAGARGAQTSAPFMQHGVWQARGFNAEGNHFNRAFKTKAKAAKFIASMRRAGSTAERY